MYYGASELHQEDELLLPGRLTGRGAHKVPRGGDASRSLVHEWHRGSHKMQWLCRNRPEGTTGSVCAPRLCERCGRRTGRTVPGTPGLSVSSGGILQLAWRSRLCAFTLPVDAAAPGTVWGASEFSVASAVLRGRC